MISKDYYRKHTYTHIKLQQNFYMKRLAAANTQKRRQKKNKNDSNYRKYTLRGIR